MTKRATTQTLRITAIGLCGLALGWTAQAAIPDSSPSGTSAPVSIAPPASTVPDLQTCDGAALTEEIKTAQAQENSIKKQIQALQTQLAAEQAQLLAISGTNDEAMTKRAALQKNIDNGNAAIATLQNNIIRLDAGIDRVKAQMARCDQAAQSHDKGDRKPRVAPAPNSGRQR